MQRFVQCDDIVRSAMLLALNEHVSVPNAMSTASWRCPLYVASAVSFAQLAVISRRLGDWLNSDPLLTLPVSRERAETLRKLP